MKAMLKAPFVRRIKKHLTEEDQKEVDNAVFPDLSAITPELLAKVRGKGNQNAKVTLEGIAVFGVTLIPGFLTKNYKFCAAIILTMIVFAIAAFVMHLRANIDESASVITLPVHHMHRTITGEKAVVYLPDGKYLLPVSRKDGEPDTVTVIRCGKTAHCIFQKKTHRKVDSE